MEDIVIIDDFLNQEELSLVQDVNTYRDSHWQIHNSTPKDQNVVDFNTPFLSKNLMDTEYYTSYLFNKIKKTWGNFTRNQRDLPHSSSRKKCKR